MRSLDKKTCKGKEVEENFMQLTVLPFGVALFSSPAPGPHVCHVFVPCSTWREILRMIKCLLPVRILKMFVTFHKFLENINLIGKRILWLT